MIFVMLLMNWLVRLQTSSDVAIRFGFRRFHQNHDVFAMNQPDSHGRSCLCDHQILWSLINCGGKLLNLIRDFKSLIKRSTEKRKRRSRAHPREIRSPASPYPYNNKEWRWNKKYPLNWTVLLIVLCLEVSHPSLQYSELSGSWSNFTVFFQSYTPGA